MRDFFQDFSYQYQRLEPVFFQLRTGLWHDETPHYLVEIQARNLQVLERVSEATNGSAIDDATEDDDESELSESELELAASPEPRRWTEAAQPSPSAFKQRGNAHATTNA